MPAAWLIVPPIDLPCGGGATHRAARRRCLLPPFWRRISRPVRPTVTEQMSGLALGFAAVLATTCAASAGAPVNPLHQNLTCVFEHGVDHKYNDIVQYTIHAANNTAECCARCKANPQCGMWVLTPATKCWLKSSYGKPGTQWVRAPGAISMCTNPTPAGSCPPSHIPAPPPPPPVPHYKCEAQRCVPGAAHVSYTSPDCFGQCNGTDTL
jgi:hypothetical protein